MKEFKANLNKAKKHNGYFGRDSTKYVPGFKYRTIDLSYGSGVVTLISYKFNQTGYEWQATFKMDALKFTFEQYTSDIWIDAGIYRMAHVNDYTDILNKKNNNGPFFIERLGPKESKSVTVQLP